MYRVCLSSAQKQNFKLKPLTDEKIGVCLFERREQARRPALKFQTGVTNLGVEQSCCRVPIVDCTNAAAFRVSSWWKLEVRRKPIHLVIAAISAV
jgi:hypothetical protein